MTEQDLVMRCREGDREAQRELYVRTSERIYRLLFRMTASRDDAFDLAQETYIKAFIRIDQFDGRASVATWVYRIAVNEALQFLRRAGRSQAILETIAAESGNETDVEQRAVRLDVNDALAAISPDDRAVLLLRYQDELDYRAIADVMGCAMGTVASRLNRARSGMRAILRKSYTSEEEVDHAEHPKGVREVSS